MKITEHIFNAITGETNIIEREIDEIEIIPLPTPSIISMRQCQLYLYNMDNGTTLQQIENYVLTLSRKAQIEWNTSAEVWRSSPMVEQMRLMFSWTMEQMDNMFLEASKL